MASPVLLLYSPIDVGEYIIKASQDRQQVRNQKPPAQQRQHLHVRKRGRADTCPVRTGASIAYQVVTVIAFGSFDCCQGFSGRNHRAPTYPQEMVDERLNIVHGARLGWWRGEGMVRIAEAVRHLVDALLDNPQALAHLLDMHDRAVIAVARAANGNVEFEL